VDETEYDEIYAQLAAVVRQLEHSWILVDVEDTIEAGNVEETEHRVGSRSASTPLWTTDLTARERVSLLIDAIESALLDVVDMERLALETLQVPSVTFQPVHDFEDNMVVITPGENSFSPVETVPIARRLLHDLRERCQLIPRQ